MEAAVAVQPISNFETNAGTFRGGRNRGPAAPTPPSAVPPVVKLGTSTEAFQKFRQERQAKNPNAKAKRVPQAPAVSMKPTKERLEKEDQPARTKSGTYRAPHPLERLRDQGKLDPNPRTNLGMFDAAEKLYQHFYEGGLKGIAAQDLSSGRFSGGDGGSCQMPTTELAAFHRQKFREATQLMGWHRDAPYRGAGRLVVDVVCFEMPVEEASRKHSLSGRTDTIKANGMEKLCEGLFILACHWRLI